MPRCLQCGIGTPTSDAESFLQAAPDAIIAIDRGGCITHANPAAAELFGYTIDVLIGSPIETLVPDELHMAHRAHRTRFNASPRSRHMADPLSRLKAKHASGRLVPVEVALSPVALRGEYRVMAVVRDATARQAAEAEQEIIRQSLDAIDDAVFMFSPETLDYSYVNTGAIRQTGYTRDELLRGMTPLHITPELSETSFRELLGPVMEGLRSATTFETVHRAKDGKDIPVEIGLTYPAAVHETARPVVAVVRDITERKEAEARLRSSERAFRAAFEDAPVPMAITDLDQTETRSILAVNDAFSHFIDRPATEVVGSTVADITHPEDLAGVEQMNELEEEGASTSTEIRFRHRDDRYVWGEVHTARTLRADGQPTTIAHIIDISRRVEAEAERDRREGLLSTLAEIRQEVRQEVALEVVLEHLADAAGRWLSAPAAAIITRSPGGELEWRAAHSETLTSEVGATLPPGSAAEAVMVSGRPLSVAQPADLLPLGLGEPIDALEPFGPLLLLPLIAPSSTEGLLVVARAPSESSFDERDTATGDALAREAAVTIALERARRDQRRMSLVQDRERIARDLHDLVIQRLFGIGMNLQATMSAPDSLREAALNAVDGLDETISVIRSSIFELTQDDDSLSGEVQRLVDRHRAVGRNDVQLEVVGDLDQLSGPAVPHVIPVLSELLTNVERHADADVAEARVVLDDTRLVIDVIDDGNGIVDERGGGFGMSNLRNRAESIGGEVKWETPASGTGTRVIWSAPIR